MVLLTWISVTKFLKSSEIQEYEKVSNQHRRKLYNLGLDICNLKGDFNVLTNLSDHQLTAHERSALNKSLKHSIMLTRFNFPFVFVFQFSFCGPLLLFCTFKLALKNYTRTLVPFWNGRTK